MRIDSFGNDSGETDLISGDVLDDTGDRRDGADYV
jgi:hypothetical protein